MLDGHPEVAQVEFCVGGEGCIVGREVPGFGGGELAIVEIGDREAVVDLGEGVTAIHDLLGRACGGEVGRSFDPERMRLRESHSMTDAMPAELVSWIESAVGARVAFAKRAGEGASRQAYAVDVETGQGTLELFCLRDNASGSGGSMRDAGVLRALGATSIPVPRVHAASPELGAILLTRVPGRGDFPHVDHDTEREPTARDLMRLTAVLHALDPAQLAIDHLGEPAARQDHAALQLAHLSGLLRTLAADGLPLQRFAAGWLERRPPRASRTSLIHSDMGPGNFLYREGAVTAILDWEVAHWGDPMEDLAAIAVRDMATPIGSLATRYAEYTEAGGAPIELAGIAWYRVYILARNTSLIALGLRRDLAPADREPLARFQLLLLRALALCLCDVVGVERPGIEVGGAPPVPDTLEGRFADPVRERELARHFAREMQVQARTEATRLGPFLDCFPQRLVAP